jgi:hypothetical protein
MFQNVHRVARQGLSLKLRRDEVAFHTSPEAATVSLETAKKVSANKRCVLFPVLVIRWGVVDP